MQVKSAPLAFCGIVGLKSTGKSVTLDQVGSRMENVVKIQVKDFTPELSVPLLSHMREGILTLPFPWCHMRLKSQTATKIVGNVFDRVKRNTGTPVTVLIDINPKQKFSGSVKDKVNSSWIEWFIGHRLPSQELFEQELLKMIPAPFYADIFVRDVKNLVADEGIMQCLFAASEGMELQDQAEREPRLRLLLAKELSVDISKKFLKKYYQLDSVDVLHLRKIPRTFSKLQDYGQAPDKEFFVAEQFSGTIQKIKRLPSKQLEFIMKAQSHPVGRDDYTKELSEEDVKAMVAANLLYKNGAALYEIQFDAIALAAREVKK